MTLGRVVRLQARVHITFRLPNKPGVVIECVVDTGFEGALALPSDAVAAMGLPFLIEIDANLADNSSRKVDVHRANIAWNQAELPVAVLAMGRRPLLGTALLDNHILNIDFVAGGEVTIHPRP